MTARRSLAAGVLATILMAIPLVVVLCLTGCRKEDKVFLDTNLAPDTRLASAPGPYSQANYRVHMYWDGSDPDGYVVAYYFAWDDTVASLWTYTTKTDSLFKAVIDTAGETRRHTFYVRAVDNEGKLDPSPARVRFDAWTEVPVVDSLRRLDGPEDPASPNHDPGRKDTVLMGTACSFAWTGSDPDGLGLDPTYAYRLDSNAFTPFSDTKSATVDSIGSGTHFFYVKAEDETGAESFPENYKFVMNFSPDSEITEPSEPTGTLTVPDKSRLIFHWDVRDKEEIEGVGGGVKEVWIELDTAFQKRFIVGEPDYQEHFMFTSDTTMTSEHYMPSTNNPTGGNRIHEFRIFAKDIEDRFETPSKNLDDREIYQFWYNFPPTTTVIEPQPGETVCRDFQISWVGDDVDGEVVQYQYVLDPQVSAWRITTENSIEYTAADSISVGPHEFRVRSLDASGCWENSYRVIEFYVEECE